MQLKQTSHYLRHNIATCGNVNFNVKHFCSLRFVDKVTKMF